MPIKPRMNMTHVVTARPDEAVAGFVKVGKTNGGGGVKVGRRVEVGRIWNAATKVGLSVGVTTGVGVGGGSTMGSSAPGERDTFAAYTQPVPRGPS